jgi:hypothetical protein
VTFSDPLPPLVLSCRSSWRIAYGGGALFLLALGTTTLAGESLSDRPEAASMAAGVVLLVLGAGCAQFFLRYCTAHLVLDAGGFRLEGPLLDGGLVAWDDVSDYRIRQTASGPASLRLVHGAGRRLAVPLIYEEAHLLEVGLGQRHFPRF